MCPELSIMQDDENISVPIPIILFKEDKWWVAFCPIFELATQGKTEKEAKENMEDLIKEYMEDPDTPKPNIEVFKSISITFSSIVLRGKTHGKIKASSST